jgi:YD repeat-containing protein
MCFGEVVTSMSPMIRSDVSAVRVGVYAHGGFRRQFDRAFRRKAAYLLAGLLIATVSGHRSYAQTASAGLQYEISPGSGSVQFCRATASSASEAVAQMTACNAPYNSCDNQTLSVYSDPGVPGPWSMLDTSVYNPRCGGGVNAIYDGTIVLAPVMFSLSAIPPVPCQVCTADSPTDPVNPAIGNVYTTETDVRFAGSGAIAFQRFYNSSDATGADGVPGWRHSYARSVNTVYQTVAPSLPAQSTLVSAQYSTPALACTSGFPTIQGAVSAWAGATATYSGGVCVIANGSATISTLPIQVFPAPIPPATATEYDVIRDDGQVLRYPIINGAVSNPPGISIRLGIIGSGFTVTDDQDTVETYNTVGALQSITSRAGVEQTIGYDANGLFQTATDSFGNSISVTRNASGSIAAIAVNGGGTVQYSYDSSQRLSTVTNLDGTTRSYTYGSPAFLNALTAVVDESGTTLSNWVYDAQERATSTTEAVGADATTLAYNSDGSVKITDALGAVRTFAFTRIGDINQNTSISGSQCPTCQDSAATTYDSAGFVNSRADYNGNLTCYANDSVRGFELVRVEGFAPGSTCPTNLASYTPAAGTTQRKTSTNWSAAYRLPTSITEATRTTAFGYDSSGNLLTKTVTDTTATPNVSRTWTYTYNGFGQVLTAQGPRTDLNSTRTYTYYTCTSGAQCGQVQTVTDELGHVTTFNTYNA